MKNIILCLFLFLSMDLSGQNREREWILIIPSFKSVEEMSTVDSCYVRLWYAFNADRIENQNTYVDLQRLEVGKNIIKYYSYFTFNSDSLCTIWGRNNPMAQSRPRRLGPGGKRPDHWSEYKYSEYFIDVAKKQLTEYSRMPFYMRTSNSQSTENIPIQKWKIHPDTKLLMGYRCQKATCTFRGRQYEAWFTANIPVSSGPWKLNGLPGLILKATDNKNEYSFECVKIEVFKNKIPIRMYNDYRSYKKMERFKLLEYQKMIHERYGKIVYQPLELE